LLGRCDREPDRAGLQGSARRGAAQLSSAQQGSAQRNAAEQDAAQLGSAQRNAAHQDAAQLGSARQGSAQRDGAQARSGLRGSARGAARVVAMAATAIVLSGCGLLSGPAALPQDDPLKMTVTSPEFGQGVPIPHQYTCHGAGETPPLDWSGAPAGTRALALVMDDADAPISPYIYWIVFNISPATRDIQAGRLPPGAQVADNSKGAVGYSPPCPAHSHEYRFSIYALNAPLQLKGGASLTAAWSAIAEHALARGRLQVTVNP
jgi:Raf kinase inhibitor-like YbhB/YbcL family protein